MATAGRILITGFEPFGSHNQNSSQLCIEKLRGMRLENPWSIEFLLLPVDLEAMQEQLGSALRRIEPQYVIHLGQSSKAWGVKAEKHASNYWKKAGEKHGRPVVPDAGAPNTLEVQLPIDNILMHMRGRGMIDCYSSMSGGNYTCNAALYTTLYTIQEGGLPILGACLLHLPLTPEQLSALPEEKRKGKNSLETSDAAWAVQLFIQKLDFCAEIPNH